MSTAQDEQPDLFDDQPADEGTSKEEPKAEEKPAEKPDAKAKEDPEGEEEDDTGADEGASGTPPEGQEGTDPVEGATTGKMIPEHRFKAALKEVTDKLTAAEQKIAEIGAPPIPDKETDPDGYDLHIRVEASKSVMRELKPDYQEVMKHYNEMAKANPDLNVKVAAHPIPAKFAYDLAKADMEIKELRAVRGSDEWKEFQEFKKAKAVKAKEEDEEESDEPPAKVVTKVPNLNRATNVSRGSPKVSEDEDLFKGAL